MLNFIGCIHRRGAENAEKLFFSFAAERPANEKPQLSGTFGIPNLHVIVEEPI